MEFPCTLGREIPRDKVMIGVGRTSTTERTTIEATELQEPATSKATANMISAGPETVLVYLGTTAAGLTQTVSVSQVDLWLDGVQTEMLS